MAPPAPPPPPALPFDLRKEPRLREILDALGYPLREPPPPHARLEAAGEGVRVTLYASGKLLLQGKRAHEVLGEIAAFGLVEAPGVVRKPSPGEEKRSEALIGSDEAGKGDFFGPLVVAAVFVDATTRPRLRALGVRDSKTLSAQQIDRLAAEIERLAPHEVISIGPERYNEMYAKIQNLNHLLAWAHARAIENLLERVPCDRVLTDQFAADPRVLSRALFERGKKVRLVQRPRAEEETAVAAASILARADFVKKIEELSDRSGIVLVKGASDRVVAAGRAFVEKHGKERLGEVAKLHFKTTAEVLSS